MKPVHNPEAAHFFATRSAHDEVGTALIESLRQLGEYELCGALASYKSPYAVTSGIVFCGAADMTDTFWRLRPADYAIAIATGATPASSLGPEWVCIKLFRLDWPKPDLKHWALRAYDFARTGS